MLTWVAGMSSALGALWLPLAAMLGVVTCALLAGGVVARRRIGAAGPPADAQDGASADAARRPPAFVLGPALLAEDQLDLDLELRACVQAHDARAIGQHLRLETAIQPGLTVRADRGALLQAMSDVLDNAIRHSEGGRVLVAAGRHGGRVQIAVLDDGAAVERAEQEAHLRGAERLLALQGGTIEVSVRPGAGSTVVIRLPEPAAARPTQAAPAAPAAAPPPAAMTRKPALRATVAQADQ
jgi:signal transduction histidine kinase